MLTGWLLNNVVCMCAHAEWVWYARKGRRAREKPPKACHAHELPPPAPLLPCRRAADGSDLLYVPLPEEALQQVLAEVDAMS